MHIVFHVHRTHRIHFAVLMPRARARQQQKLLSCLRSIFHEFYSAEWGFWRLDTMIPLWCDSSRYLDLIVLYYLWRGWSFIGVKNELLQKEIMSLMKLKLKIRLNAFKFSLSKYNLDFDFCFSQFIAFIFNARSVQ